METIRIEFPIKNNTAYVESDAVSAMVAGLKKLQEFKAITGNLDDIVQNYEIANPGGYAVAIINKDALIDASKLQSVGATLSFPMDIGVKEVDLSDRSFSAATINERLRIKGLDPRQKFRLTILDYKKYYNSNKNKLSKDPVRTKRLRDLFAADIMSLFSEILPYIQEGKQLQALTGLNNVTSGLNDHARQLSVAYRKALQQAKNGQLSSSVFKPLQASYSMFMDLLILQVFPGIENILGSNKTKVTTGTVEGDAVEETRTHSEVKGTIVLQTSNPDKYFELLGFIKDLADRNKTFNIIVNPDSDELEDKKVVTIEGDANDRLQRVMLSKVETNRVYSLTEDGNLDLFD